MKKMVMAGSLLLFLAYAFSLAVAGPGSGHHPLRLRAGAHAIEAEVAATLQARDVGLSGRTSLPASRGMLFVFPEAHRHCMWMRDTHIPLSVAFLADDGAIVNIAEMPPENDMYYCADKPVHYVLEMGKGWFSRRGLRPGDRIRGVEKAPSGS